jgi:pSer/pThr/pTyr-binding forkhead associated (FHA) protein
MSQQDYKDFFISYNGADQRWAEWIAWQLEEAAYSVILQAWDFLPGSNFVIQMDRALTLAPRMIAVLSPQYLSSLYTQPEWAAAFRHDPKGEQSLLIPVRVQPCEVTGLLGPIVYVDLVGRDEATARQRLLAAVRHERAKPSQAPAFPQTVQHTISKQLNFPGDLPPIWNMPHQRDPLFLGREQLLQELHTSLATDHTVLLFEPDFVHEAGSSGATGTAVEYAYRFRSDYQVIAWIQADSRGALRSDLLSLATALHFPQANLPDQDPFQGVVQWLRTHQHWLLVLDRVHEQEVLSPLMPLPQQGHLLLVTATRSLESLAPLIELNQVPWEERTVLMQLSQVVGAALQGPEGRIPLGLEPITIGRASTNQVVLRDPSVSSRHAIIALKDQAYWVADTGSTNGTMLNQQRLVPQVPLKLHPGDTIRLGNITCTYEVIDRPSRSPVSSPSSEQGNTSAGVSPLSTPIIERPQQDRVGQRFGNYRLSKLLGQGGFAEVYLGEHIFLDTQTAIKVLYTQLVGQDVEQFRQEARTIAHMEHPLQRLP